MAEPSSDFPNRIADLLEDIADRIRSVTVDRVANGVTWAAVGIVMAMAGFLVLFWIGIGLFRAFGELVGQETAYAITGVVLVVTGAILWAKRFPKDRPDQD